MGTESNPVLNLRAKDFNSFSLVKSAPGSPVPTGYNQKKPKQTKKTTKGAAC